MQNRCPVESTKIARGRCRAAMSDEVASAATGRRKPPRLVEQIGLGAQPHRRLEHFAGVARVRDRPLRIVRLIPAVLASHLRVVREAARREQHSLPSLDEDRRPVSRRPDAAHPTVFDDQIVHRRVRPHRRRAGKVDQGLEHLPHQRRPVGEQLLPTQRAGLRAEEHARGGGERLRRPVEVLHRAQLVRLHREPVALGEARLELVVPLAELPGVERHALDRAPAALPPLAFG